MREEEQHNFTRDSRHFPSRLPHAVSGENITAALLHAGIIMFFFPQLAGLAIYAARGLQSGTAEITAVIFTACGGASGWQYLLEK